MKALLLITAVLLSSCAGDVAGLSLQARLRIYALAAGWQGKTIEITLEGPEP